MEDENKVKNKRFTDDPPLTKIYVSNGVTVEIYGELNIKVLANALLVYYNQKNPESRIQNPESRR